MTVGAGSNLPQAPSQRPLDTAQNAAICELCFVLLSFATPVGLTACMENRFITRYFGKLCGERAVFPPGVCGTMHVEQSMLVKNWPVVRRCLRNLGSALSRVF